MMIAAAFLVLLRPYSIQCVLLLLLLLLGTIATILFFCCWHRRLRNGKHPIKSVLSGRTKSRVGLRSHHFRSEGFRHSPRHARRSIHARVTEEKPNLVEIPESEPDSSSSLRKRKVKKRVLPEFYQSVQVTPTRKPILRYLLILPSFVVICVDMPGAYDYTELRRHRASAGNILTGT